MTEQQKFQPGDRVKVTMELTVSYNPGALFSMGVVDLWSIEQWAKRDHITVELVERPEPPREHGLYPCTQFGTLKVYLWDGKKWRHYGAKNRPVTYQDEVTVAGDRITLHEGIEL